MRCLSYAHCCVRIWRPASHFLALMFQTGFAVIGKGAEGVLQVAYIDTEGTFRAEKIRAIAARFDLDADAVLDNVSPTQWLMH